MADYEKMTVANLRVLLKDRGIPSTGLTRKAQIVAKLQEEDAAAAAASSASVEIEKGSEPQLQPTNAVVEEEQIPASVPEQTHPEPVSETQALSSPAPEQPAQHPPIEADPALKTDSVSVPNAPIQPSASKEETVTTGLEFPAYAESKSMSATRSLSQTPLPSKEDPIAQSQRQASTSTTPVPSIPSREDTVATTQTDTDERKKRKRRSGSPPIDTQEVAIKRAKVAEDVHLKEDAVPVPLASTQEDVRMIDAPSSTQESEREHAIRYHGVEGKDMVPLTTRTLSIEEGAVPSARPEIRPSKDIRHQQAQRVEQGQPEAPEPVLVKDLPTPAPSTHVASRALYIRNFMRPLQLITLKTHLAALAGSADVDVVEIIFVDSIKTHAFIQVKTLAAAARIRAGMHNQIWPKERDRKPLWVDYIPEEKIQTWIDTEENAGSALGSRVGGRKWEVVYEHDGDSMVAQHVEVGSGPQVAGPSRPVPTGPSQSRHISISKAPAAPKPAQPEAIAKTFIALDQLFESTKAKPMLYFKPVDIKVADDRLDELDYATGKRWSTRDQKESDELRRYTFDNEKLVETGIHHNKGRGGFNSGRGSRGAPTSRYGRGAPRGAPRGNWHR